jgi:hypothetical protein
MHDLAQKKSNILHVVSNRLNIFYDLKNKVVTY